MKNAIRDYCADVRPELLNLIRALCAIPAPSGREEARAEFCRKWFADNGFENVSVDRALNVLAPVNVRPGAPLVVVMAHTDTVFPDTEPMPVVEKDGFLASPGVVDDTANLAVMMVCARFFRERFRPGSSGFLFVANSGEEGLGNLKGSRRIVETFGGNIREFISLDGSTFNRVTVRAVGSRRHRVRVRTEGGHSFTAFGNRNAIHVLSALIAMLYTVKVPAEGDSTTTYNVGTISGGTSVNTIAQDAEMLFEYRSDSRVCLEKMGRIFADAVETFRAAGAEIDVELLGERPCSAPVDQERFDALKGRIAASLRETLNLEFEAHSGSTDCNIPLSVGIPAACFGVCRGTGCHTREEKLDLASLEDGCRLLLDFLGREND